MRTPTATSRIRTAACILLATAFASAGLVQAAPTGPEEIVNGDFSGGMNGWSYAVPFGGAEIELFDTSGFGEDLCFGDHTLLISTFTPPPAALSQTIEVVSGLTYEISFDVAASRNVNTFPWLNPGPLVECYVDGQLVAQRDFGEIPSFTVKRDTLCGRYTAKSSGPIAVEIRIHPMRPFAFIGVPRVNLDNVSMRSTIGPTLHIAGQRNASESAPYHVFGTPGAMVGIFASPRMGPGSQLPDTLGTWYLSARSARVLLVQLDNNGEAHGTLQLPGGLEAAGRPVIYQALEVGPLGRRLGLPRNYGAR